MCDGLLRVLAACPLYDTLDLSSPNAVNGLSAEVLVGDDVVVTPLEALHVRFPNHGNMDTPDDAAKRPVGVSYTHAHFKEFVRRAIVSSRSTLQHLIVSGCDCVDSELLQGIAQCAQLRTLCLECFDGEVHLLQSRPAFRNLEVTCNPQPSLSARDRPCLVDPLASGLRDRRPDDGCGLGTHSTVESLHPHS
jgi:hypothetical protein